MVKRPRPTKHPNLIALRVSDELLAEIDAKAEKAQMSRSDTVRELVILGLNRIGPPK